MKLKEILEALQSLKPEQLEQESLIFLSDNESEPGVSVSDVHITDEDFYFLDGECVGNLENCKETFGEDYEEEMTKVVKVPAGRVEIWCVN